MARTGTSTIIEAARVICRMRGLYGARDLAAATTAAFETAVIALEVACRAWEALDDQAGQIDNVAPIRPGEDGPPNLSP